MTKFLRRVWSRYSKLGKGRKKKQKWKKPTGRDNKMREKRKGYPPVVSIGYGTQKNKRKKVLGKELVIIKNLKEFEEIKGDKTIMLGNIGKKKKIEILKKAKEKNIKIYKTNIEKFLKNKSKKHKGGKNEPKKEERTSGKNTKSR